MATAQVKHHDYHLVDPSPWPIVGAVPRRSGSRHPRSAVRRRVAAQGHRDLRSLASAAVEYAVALDLGHHSDLGASRAIGERSPGVEIRLDADDCAWRLLHLRAGL